LVEQHPRRERPQWMQRAELSELRDFLHGTNARNIGFFSGF